MQLISNGLINFVGYDLAQFFKTSNDSKMPIFNPFVFSLKFVTKFKKY